MFRPPFLARVAAGAAVYALEESRRLPTAAMNFPITAVSQMLQTTMHVQQFVTSLALKGDEVFDRLANRPTEQPEWATFDEDFDDEPASRTRSRFDLYGDEELTAAFDSADSLSAAFEADSLSEESAARANGRNGRTESADFLQPKPAESDSTGPEKAEAESLAMPTAGAEIAEPESAEVAEPEIATRYGYATMTLAQLRARLRMLTLDDLTALLDYEQRTRARAPFVTMLTNRIATVRAQ